MIRIKSRIWPLLCAVLVLSGCAGTPQESDDAEYNVEAENSHVNDPLKGLTEPCGQSTTII